MTPESVATRAMRDALATVRALADAHPPALSFVPVPRSGAPRLMPGDGPKGGPLGRAAARLACGQTSATALLEDALGAIAARDRELNVFVEVCFERALAEARARDDELRRGALRGPLHGIPVSVKDVIHVADVPTRAGSDAYSVLPGTDAPSVALLREAGAVIIGKTTAHEFALGVTTPQTRNPHDPTRIPGGSSGGSAAAVATGMGLASLGTDTRASSRIPPALCGVVGFKATFGLVPAAGLVQLSWSLDHVAPIAGSVADAALVLDALTGDRLSAFCGADVSRLRVGIPTDGTAGADPEVGAGFAGALDRLAALAGSVAEVARPSAADFDEANAVGLLVSRCEAAAYHRNLGLDRRRYWSETRDQLDVADEVPAVDYVHALRLRSALAESMLKVFDDVDVLAMPTSLVPAPRTEEAERYLTVLSRNAIPWSLVGFPAVSLPCGATQGGLPIGLQLVAPPYEEASLVALGTALES